MTEPRQSRPTSLYGCCSQAEDWSNEPDLTKRRRTQNRLYQRTRRSRKPDRYGTADHHPRPTEVDRSKRHAKRKPHTSKPSTRTSLSSTAMLSAVFREPVTSGVDPAIRGHGNALNHPPDLIYLVNDSCNEVLLPVYALAQSYLASSNVYAHGFHEPIPILALPPTIGINGSQASVPHTYLCHDEIVQDLKHMNLSPIEYNALIVYEQSLAHVSHAVQGS